jgi:DNA modification methylase
VNAWELRTGNALELLREMPEESVHCCITSPPYFNLRDYGTGVWVGGDEGCDHLRRDLADNDNLSRSPASTRGGGASRKGADHLQYGSVCEKCGAERVDDQIGLEDTPEEFVAKLVEILGEVKRVLRDDGTLWLNLGDSYARSAGPRHGNFGRSAKGIGIPENRDTRRVREYAKSKDLLGIPWMVAFALRAAGWYLRSEIIWAKPNPMPASVTDRPTVAHETVFLLAKSERYFYDAVAIREPDKGGDHARTVHDEPSLEPSGGLLPRHRGLRRATSHNGRGANKRSVWTVATRPYPKAHYATFPVELIEPMVLAGCPREVCSECGAPVERVVEREFIPQKDVATSAALHRDPAGLDPSSEWGETPRGTTLIRTLGWEATCDCASARSVPGVILDPFVGSGTTLQAAVRNGRSAIGLDLDPDNEELVHERMAGVTASMFDPA